MSLQQPVTGEFFVALFDLTNFAKVYKSQTAETLFEILSEFTAISSKVVEGAGGRIVKFSNDSGLATFPMAETDKGVLAMMKLKTQIDEWAKYRIPGSQLAMNAHVGSATWGSLCNGQYEIVGEVVSMVYTMGRRQFQISPQTFRSLSAETRKAFRKFTPPIVYKLGM